MVIFMKYLIASDIHGSAYFCEQLINRFNDEKADKLLLLGDILYHGPRNDLPVGYDPKRVIEMLNSLSDKILCVRGNCDSEVDQMVLDFPIMADYLLLNAGNKTVFATHGHVYNEEKLPKFARGDILLHGHTHVTSFVNRGEYSYFNPGSVSIPKENTDNGYMILNNNCFIWKKLNGEVIKEIEV